MIQNLMFGNLIFENIISVSDIQLFYIRPYIFDFLAESLKAIKN